MRSGSLFLIAVLAPLVIRCGGAGSTRLSHPTLDQDYAGRFNGTWQGPATLNIGGQVQTTNANQRIDSAGLNRLSLSQVCAGSDGTAGLDTPTTFSMDPLTCAPLNQSCGAVTIRYDNAIGSLAQDTLTLTFAGTASGCGQSLAFTLRFTGRLPDAADGGVPDAGTPDSGVPDAGAPDAGPVDHGPPSAVVAASSVDATAGHPVILDASASADPDGHPLTYAWTIAYRPPGVEPILTGNDLATPTFTPMVEGSYVLSVRVTASDGQYAEATVSVSAHQPVVGAPTFIDLQSDPGDYIGAGGSYGYTKANARITVGSTAGHLTLAVAGDQTWQMNFQMPSGFARIESGIYDGLQRYPFHDPAQGGLDWSGEGRGCNTLTGSVAVDSVTYSSGTLTAIEMRFEQHCEGVAASLHGHIQWDANDPTQPPGPASPPAGLWQAAPGSTPASGNYVYLQSEPGDFIGFGSTFTYTQADASISVAAASGNAVSVRVTGDENWFGDFQAMSTLAQLQIGYYGNLQRYPFHNPTRGGLDWSGEGRGCNRLTGWFVVDSVTYTGGALTAIDLRFEQHCEGGVAALHGQIHWDASDTTVPPGPIQPPPPDLWQPVAGSTPGTGNYVYLKSDPGDYIGGGGTFTYTPASTPISVSTAGNRVSVGVDGWFGDFQAMSSLTQLQLGYYANLQRYPFHNPVRGGLNWSGQGRGCNTLTGWFVVDGLTYAGAALTAIDLRFEQHCEGGGPALHGQIHWKTGT